MAVAALVASAFVASASASQTTPAALYRALLTTPIPGSSLPSGFSPPASAQRASASLISKRLHIVGVVQIFLNGGQDNGLQYGAAAFYNVFPNHQDALADYRAATHAGQIGTPKSFPTPARILHTGLPNGGARYDAVEYVDRNVVVFAYVNSLGVNPLPRDALAEAISLGTFTLHHLETVRGSG
jgi:hypothetical protein